MKITRDAVMERTLLDALKRSFEQDPRDGIHVSDLLNVRFAYFQRINPQPIRDDEVLYFLAGRGHEDAFGRLSGFVKQETRTTDGIAFTPDFYQDLPVEFKTRRRWLPKPGEEASVFQTYLEQCLSYSALDWRAQSWLWVFSLLEKDSELNGTSKPVLACYRVVWTPEELRQWKDTLVRRKQQLEIALDIRCHDDLPLCWAFKCGRMTTTMLTPPTCGCGRTFKSEWGAGKHSDANPTHTMTPPTTTKTYEIKCPHYQSCQPYLIDKTRGNLRARDSTEESPSDCL